MHPIKVMIVDDHTLFRKSLRSLLNQDDRVEVIAEADSLTTLQEMLPKLTEQLQVILMDYHLGDEGPDGADAATWLTENMPKLPVIMLTMYDDREVLVRAAKAGAAGYVLKDSEVEDLVAAISMASRGKGYLSPEMAGRAMSEMARAPLTAEQDPEVTPATYSLTPREMDVLERLVQGRTYNELAAELSVSVSQIKQLAGSIFTKLGAKDKAHAAAIAVAKRLVPPPE